MAVPAPPLLLITDRRQAVLPLDRLVAAACAAGCRWISLREKDLPPADRLALLGRVLASARPFGATVTVHGDIGAAARCDGVHLPGGGDVPAARARLGPRALIGLSCHDIADIAAAAAAGADYVTLSPVFLTASKPGYGPALGVAALEASRSSGIPVIALGGIGPDTLAACRRAGAAGAAVMGAVMRSPDPGAVVGGLLAAL
jgi:thiamine-phosphate pyrophosphorylase